jgi:hypothetical protein
MSKIPLPKAIELQQILSMMYGSGLKAENGEPVPAEPGSKSLVAVYVDDDDQPVVACAVDYPFTAYAGASLTRIPLGTAKECAGNGDFSEIMLGNVHEIMNICSRLLMNSGSPHLRLQTLYRAPDELPDTVQELIRGSSRSADFSVTFPDYGDGRVSFRALAA